MKNGVTFQEKQKTQQTTQQKSVYARLLIKLGIVKNEKSANMLLIVIAILAFAGSGYILYSSTFQTEEIQQQPQGVLPFNL